MRPRLLVYGSWVAMWGASHLSAAPVALWLFDEPTLAQAVPGKFGAAFRSPPPEAAPDEPTDSVAEVRGGSVSPKLNLGAGDWTLECWLKLDSAAATEGVIFEIGAGPRKKSERVTRFSVLPGENAFVVASLLSEPDGIAPRVEFSNPIGPPGGVAWRGSTTLPRRSGPLPRGAWFHVAFVHEAAKRALTLFVDGRREAMVASKIVALPDADAAYVAIGRDGEGGRRLGGAIDELRICDEVAYDAEFTPPGSFATAPKS